MNVLRGLLVTCAALACFAWARPCAAQVERFAIVIGNDQGLPGEQPLRFATQDAKRVYDVLHELGDFAPVNMVLLENKSAADLRSTLISVNDRVRALTTLPSRQVMLFVYYSGHGDASALHLGGSRFPVTELYQLVRGSAAQVRLLVLDACQSGALARRKGGRVAAPFPIPKEQTLSGEGFALLTASAAEEDSQESDELGASFFTQAFVSGLLGAADSDRNGEVVLEELYRYAYDATLRATSRTADGVQHPTFSYDLSGQGQLVLTRPALRDASRGLLALPDGASYLVLRGGSDGPLVAEVGERASVRSLSLAPGTYFLRGRASHYLLEGGVEVLAASTTAVEAASLHRVEYAQLVRKGGSTRLQAHGLEAGASARTVVAHVEQPCLGGYVGYRLDRRTFAFSSRFGICKSGFKNELLQARIDEYELGLRLDRVWDVARRLSLALGAGLGAGIIRQRFYTHGHAPRRRSLAGSAELHGVLGLEIHRGSYLALDLAASLYVLPMAFEGLRRDLRAEPAARASLGLGKRF